MIDELTAWIQENYNITYDAQARLLYTLVVIIILFLVRLLTNAILKRRIEDKATLFRWRKNSGYLILGIGVFLTGIIWLRGAGSVATYLGLVSAALVIALQDPISNFVGWVFIISRRPFAIEDRLEIDGVAGDVIDIRFFQFTLNEIGNWVDAEQSTGRVIHIPNRKVFSHNVANYSQGFPFLWNEIPVMVTFESDWRKAKSLLQTIGDAHTAELNNEVQKRVKQASKRYLIYYKNVTPIVYTKVADSGIVLTLRYLIPLRKRRGSEEMIWEEILDAFALDPALDFAYPTQRIYYHPVEGPQQPGAKPTAPL